MIYVGTTKNKLRQRISQHQSDQRSRNKEHQKTALANHCARTEHIADFENANILYEERNYSKRLTLEMLHIAKTPAQIRINYKADTENIAQVYKEMITQRQ